MFFLAGYDNTAYNLSFLFHQLVVHPEIQEKLYDEIQEVIGDKVSLAPKIVAFYVQWKSCDFLQRMIYFLKFMMYQP